MNWNKNCTCNTKSCNCTNKQILKEEEINNIEKNKKILKSKDIGEQHGKFYGKKWFPK